MRNASTPGRSAGEGLRRVAISVALSCASSGPLLAGTPTPATPGKEVPLPIRRGQAATTQAPEGLARLREALSLAEVVDIALANSPLTRASYRRARSAAEDLSSERGAYLPRLDGSAGWTRSKQPQIDGGGAPLSAYGPGLSLSYLLFDFGGRSGKVEEARQALLFADWQHNATLHDVVLNVQQAYFGYLTAKAQRDAAAQTLAQAQTSLDAANARHAAGVATIADVLQARTALSQAQLDVEGLDGQVLAVRGSLATAMGLAADAPLDIGTLPADVPIDRAQPAVTDLIADARLNRPDLAAARAQAEKAAAHVGTVRADGLPSLALRAGANRTYYRATGLSSRVNSWSAGIQLDVPLFHGFSDTHDVRSAREGAAAARADAESYEQRVALEVWTSYYALATAAQRVRTSRALLESATQSEQVALGRYKEGVGTVLDLLTAQAALANARAQEIQARSDWFVALARLAHDSGRLKPVLPEEKIER